MTSDDIICMAKEAGFDKNSLGTTFTHGKLDENLEKFASLVAAAEREACAKLCDEMAEKDRLTNYYKVAANAIRARGQA